MAIFPPFAANGDDFERNINFRNLHTAKGKVHVRAWKRVGDGSRSLGDVRTFCTNQLSDVSRVVRTCLNRCTEDKITHRGHRISATLCTFDKSVKFNELNSVQHVSGTKLPKNSCCTSLKLSGYTSRTCCSDMSQ